MKSALKVQTNTQALRGQVEALFYSSPGFSAGRIKAPDKTTAMFAGKFCVREGDPVVLHGAWGTHAKYGRQFQAEWFEYDAAPPAEGLAQYLANHPALKGIGPVKARRIAEKYAEGFDQALAEHPEEIAKAAGVPLATIETLAAEWDRVAAVRSALTILSAYGLTHHQVTTLVEKHGNGIVALLQEDPYRLVGEIKGMGFKRVDKVARQFGTAKTHPSRIRAGIVSCVQEALDQGDCWVEWRDLVEQANALLLIDRLESRELIERELEGLTQGGELAAPSHFGRIQVGLPFMIVMETALAEIFRRGAQPNPVLKNRSDQDFEADFVTYAGALNDDQRRAFINAARHSISLISGGAGSGKTFALTSIADFYAAQGFNVTLTAPTGKAAKRMEQVTGRPAQTIHRLLEYNGREFGRGPDNPLGADLVIADEVSMTDVPLFWRLFRAIDLTRTAVVLVGDHNQLPPVGPGDVLRDLIHSAAVPTVILDKIVRQAGVLKENCTAVLTGKVCPSVKDAAGTPPWLVSDRFTEAEAARDFLVSLFDGGTLDRLGYDLMRDVQVLTPTHLGPLGTRELNIALQRIIQQRLHDFIVPQVPLGRSPRIYLHDKVMQTRNDYKLGVMNGAVGICVCLPPSSVCCWDKMTHTSDQPEIVKPNIGVRDAEELDCWRRSDERQRAGAPLSKANNMRHGIYANRFLTPEERPIFDTIIGQLYQDFVFNKSSDFMQVELVAVYFLKLGRAQEAGDWETSERLDRMIRCHLKDLKATKIAREGEAPKGPDISPADWATALLEKVAGVLVKKPETPAEDEKAEEDGG